ncbi:HAMP domain-containing sensor histidine kinase [Nocardioides nanhaiensis]|uniref:histidine kinase n=1 Tax=Nocardioides nanhaiensis TaxID=1476871 RepID=A0ABP8W3V8_9ACTN
MSDGVATPSLRRRVTAFVLLALTAVLLVLVVSSDRALSARLESQLRDRLVDRAGFADVLAEQLEGRDLARRLEGDGVSVLLVDDGEVFAEGPLAGAVASTATPAVPSTPQEPEEPEPRRPPSAAPAPVPRDGPAPDPAGPATEVVEQGDLLRVDRSLGDDEQLVLVADTADVRATVAQVRLVLGVVALAVLLLAGLAVPWLVGRALSPLDRITEVARQITRGDRQRRLDPHPATSELGRTATAFDEVLDAVVGAEQRAIASEQRLRTFLSDAAHDLRTPLTGAQAAAEHVLREDPPRAERERVLTTLVRETRRAGRLVEDMLLMTRIDQGLELRRERLRLGTVAAEVLAARELGLPGVTLTLDDGGPDGAAGTEVVADRDRLSRLVGNLVDNAAQAGAARVAVQVASDPAAGRVVLVVEDDGPGVPPAERERVFERMVRLDEARSGAGGSGLGLPIARGIARAHGGDLVCGDAVRGSGARFELRLPAAPPA